MTVKIGTRASPLALWQADRAQDHLIEAWGALADPDRLSIVEVTTTGDRIRDRPLADIGGKVLPDRARLGQTNPVVGPRPAR